MASLHSRFPLLQFSELIIQWVESCFWVSKFSEVFTVYYIVSPKRERVMSMTMMMTMTMTTMTTTTTMPMPMMMMMKTKTTTMTMTTMATTMMTTTMPMPMPMMTMTMMENMPSRRCFFASIFVLALYIYISRKIAQKRENRRVGD